MSTILNRALAKDKKGNDIALMYVNDSKGICWQICEYEKQSDTVSEQMANAAFICLAANNHAKLVEAVKLQAKLIDDMSRFVGQMALKDYALFNEAPIKARSVLKDCGVEV